MANILKTHALVGATPGTYRVENGAGFGTTGAGQIEAGVYQFSATCTGAGTVQLFQVSGGSQTQIGPTLTASGVISPRQLPAGVYEVVVTGFSAVNVSLERVA